MLKALIKLYQELGTDNIIDDYKNEYLQEHTARNGNTVLWYIDELHNIAIYTDSAEFLSEKEIEEQLM